MWKQLTIYVVLGAVIFGAGGLGCDRGTSIEPSEKPKVVVTTTILEDLVRQIGGEDFTVVGLVGPGADPHVYQPRPSDAREVSRSDAVVMNGLLLEGWMENMVRHAGGERPVIVAGDAVEEEKILRVAGAIDPHVWFDVSIWRQVAAHVADELVKVAGTDEALIERLRQRHEGYDRTLEELDQWTRRQMQTIPAKWRVLITSHDAFSYFGRAYGIDVEAIQGLSTEQEASQRDLANIIELVKRRATPAVFMESSVHPGLIQQVARETQIQVAGPLYSDSVGAVGSGAETYVGMVQRNVEMITEALGGKYQAFEMSSTAAQESEENVEQVEGA